MAEPLRRTALTTGKPDARRLSWSSAVVLLLALALLAVRPIASRQPVAGGPQWPPAPDVARIRFVAEIREPKDIDAGPNVVGRLWGLLVGRSRQPRCPNSPSG